MGNCNNPILDENPDMEKFFEISILIRLQKTYPYEKVREEANKLH